MPLSDAQKQKAHDSIRAKAKSGCAVCGNTQLSLAPELVAVPGLTGTAVHLEQITPLLAVVCSACGHVMFFSAKLMDLV
jgi:predicted nucleic-acid-binding Zn-ribbon protein